MHCLGCSAARGETVAEACAVHGTDADMLVNKINEYLAGKAE
jgi:hybrid cluster-associated redox disulfide protein